VSKAKPLEPIAHAEPVRIPADAVVLDGDLATDWFTRHLVPG
jgi:hypothetical protein